MTIRDAVLVELERRGQLPVRQRMELSQKVRAKDKSVANYADRYGLDTSVFDELKGAGETALTMGSAMLAEPISGWLGLASLPFGADVSSRVIQGTQDALTYQPRTQEGQRNLAGLGEALAPISEGFEGASRYLGDTAYDLTGSPTAGAIGYSLPTAGLELLGLGGARKASKAGMLGNQYEFGNVPTRSLGKQEGIFAGVRAKNADLQALEQAKALEAQGLDRADIWQQTGWYNDAGDWKFELDDSERFYIPTKPADPRDIEIAQNRYDTEDAKFKEWLKENTAIYRDKNTDPEVKKMMLKELEQKRASLGRIKDDLDKAKQDVSETVLGKAFDTEAMYEYPELQGIGFDHKDAPLEYRGGYTDIPTEGIFVNRGHNLANQESTALHELQHAIQEREGFQRGGGTAEFESDFTNVNAKDLASKFGDASMLRRMSGEKYDIDRGIKRFEMLTGRKPTQDIIDMSGKMDADWLSRRANIYKAGDPYEAYRRLAGEAEARNVQTRQDFTPEQRRATPPWQTLDVPESELIRRSGGMSGLQMSQDLPINKNEIVYHGTPRGYIDKFKPFEHDENPMMGIATTTNPEIASKYASDFYERTGLPQDQIQPTVYPMYTRGKIGDAEELLQQMWDEGLDMSLDDYAIEQGYTGLRTSSAGLGEQGEIFMFDPDNLVSVFDNDNMGGLQMRY